MEDEPKHEWSPMDVAIRIMDEMHGYDMVSMNIEHLENDSISFSLMSPVGIEYRITIEQAQREREEIGERYPY